MPEQTGDLVLADRIRTRRLVKGMTQEQLGAACDPPIDQRTISSYETGERDVSTAVKRQLAQALETTVAYLVGEVENPLRPADRLRALGLEPGNVSQISDEVFASALVTLIEEFTTRSTKRALQPPPAADQQGGLDDDGRGGATAQSG